MNPILIFHACSQQYIQYSSNLDLCFLLSIILNNLVSTPSYLVDH